MRPVLVVVVGRASAWTGCPGDSLRGRPPVLVVLVVLLVLPLPPRRHDLPPGLRGGPLRPLLPSLPVLSLLLLHDGGLVGFLVHLSLQGHPLGAPSLGVNGLPLLLRQDTLQLFLQLVRPVQDLPGFSTELPLFFVFGLLLLLLRPAVGIRRVQSLTTHTNQSINQSSTLSPSATLTPFSYVVYVLYYLFLHLTYIPSPRRRQGRSLSWR